MLLWPNGAHHTMFSPCASDFYLFEYAAQPQGKHTTRRREKFKKKYDYTSYEPARAHGVRDESSRPSHHLIGDLKFGCWDLKFGRYRPYLYLS